VRFIAKIHLLLTCIEIIESQMSNILGHIVQALCIIYCKKINSLKHLVRTTVATAHN